MTAFTIPGNEVPLMAPRSPRNLLWAISPICLSTVIVGVGILFTFFPSAQYERLINEQNLMFLNGELYIFILSCWWAFVGGATVPLLNHVLTVKANTQQKIFFPSTTSLTIILLLLIIIILNVYLCAYIVFNVGWYQLVSAFFGSVDANELRTEIAKALATIKSAWIPYASVGFLSWCFWVRITWRRQYAHSLSSTLKMLFNCSVMFSLLGSLMTFARGPVIGMAISLGAIYVFYRVRESKLKVMELVKAVAIFCALFFLLFSIIELTRHPAAAGSSSDSMLFEHLTGYFITPYNHLAAMLSGQLALPNSGSGNYAFKGLVDAAYYSGLLDVESIRTSFGLELVPPGLELWLIQFSTVSQAGFNEAYIWTTAFGDAYADLGWLSPVYFLFYGILAGYSYASFKKATIFGIVVYPYVLLTILMWVSGLSIANRNIFLLVGIVILIKLIDMIFVAGKKYIFEASVIRRI